MRRLHSVVLPVALVVTVLAGCGQASVPTSGSGSGTPVATTGVPGGATADAPTGAPVGAPPGPTLTPAAPPTATTAVGLRGTLRTVKTADVTLTALMGVGSSKYPAGPIVRGRAGLVVDYTLVNTGKRSLAVYDRVPDDLGSAALGQVNPEHAWVYMSGPVLRVSKQSFDTAPNVRFAAAPVTGVRPLPVGGTVTGRAWVPLPPKLDVPGKSFSSPGGRGLALDIFTWQFCVQVGDLGEHTGPVTDSLPQASSSSDSSTAKGAVRPAPASAPGADELICTDPVPLVTP